MYIGRLVSGNPCVFLQHYSILHPSICASVHLSIDLYIHVIRLSCYPHVCASLCLFTCVFIHLCVHPSVCSSIGARCLCPSLCLSVCVSIQLCVCVPLHSPSIPCSLSGTHHSLHPTGAGSCWASRGGGSCSVWCRRHRGTGTAAGCSLTCLPAHILSSDCISLCVVCTCTNCIHKPQRTANPAANNLGPSSQ